MVQILPNQTTEPPPSSAWHVLGVGAIGGAWAALLSAAGKQVCLLLKDQEALKRYQLKRHLILEDSDQSRSYFIPAIVPEQVTQPIQRLIITTKAHQTLQAIQPLKDKLVPGALVVLIQNGMGQQDEVMGELPGARLVVGLTQIGVWCPEPFVVRLAGKGVTYLGSYAQGPFKSNEDWFQDLSDIGLPLVPQPHIQGYLWQKLIINACINPLTALMDCPNGDLLKDDLLNTVRHLWNEIEPLVPQMNLPMPVDAVFPLIQQVLRNTANNSSSMRQDYRHHRTTEIDYITGHLIRFAQQHGVELPLHEFLRLGLIKGLIKGVKRQ